MKPANPLFPCKGRRPLKIGGEFLRYLSISLAACGVAAFVTLGVSDAAARDIGSASKTGVEDGPKEHGMTTKRAAKGRTEVTVFKPVTYDEPTDGPKLNEVQLTETFVGDVEGEGKARVLQAQWADGSLEYCTIERVVGALAGRRGSFLLQVEGTVQGKHNEGAWSVIAGSGTGDLRGLRGDGGFDAELGKHGSWTLNYWFE
jgi:hypothetical protein